MSKVELASGFSCPACGKQPGGGAESKSLEANRCAGCHKVYYCNRDCQKANWKDHKVVCKALTELAKSKKGHSKEIIKEGEKGNAPKPGQEAFVHYTGTLPNGKVFDSSRKTGSPFSFILGVGQVIQGWDEGVRTMNKGEVAKFVISSDHAYGESGSPPAIPPNTPLIFEVELLDFKDAELVKTGTNFL